MRVENAWLETHCRYKGRTALIWCMEAPHGQKSSRAGTLRALQQYKPPLRPIHWSGRTRSQCS